MVNVNDFESPTTEGVQCKLNAIFVRQKELMDKYHHIEEKNGLLQTGMVPVDLHDRFGQARLKDFAWRVTEELAEATEALTYEGKGVHFKEELMDALHFLVELHILSGYGPVDIAVTDPKHSFGPLPEKDLLDVLFEMVDIQIPGPDIVNPSLLVIRGHIYVIIEDLGKAMNCLKQKPWKQSHILTDADMYRAKLTDSFHSFVRVAALVGMTSQDVFDLYFRKSEVNKFRQKSKY